MRLSNLKLKNFRNYHETKLEFSPNINVLIGENAQGKTNLLESIYVLAMTKSHRTTNDRELIEFSEKSAFLEGIVEKKTGNLRLSLSLSKKGKTARVNSLETPRLSQYIGKLNVKLNGLEKKEHSLLALRRVNFCKQKKSGLFKPLFSRFQKIRQF